MDADKLCGACCVISFVTLFLLIISSFSSLEVNELGLDYSSISKKVGSDFYGAGYHFLGIGHSFIKYPKTVQQFEFSDDGKNSDYGALHSRTSDGLEVQLEISFQYRLQPDKIFSLFQKYKDNYKQIFMNMAIDVLTNSATQYQAYQFFINRQEIGTQMQMSLNEHFMKENFSVVEFFQLRSVDLPDKFEESIQLSEVYKQNINKSLAEKDKAIVELETLKKKAEYQKEVIKNVAEGDAVQLIREGEAKATSFLVRQGANAKSYKALKNKLQMKNEELIDYVREKVVREHEDTSLIISIEGGRQDENAQN